MWKTLDASQVIREAPRRFPDPVTVHSPLACGLLRIALQALTKAKRLADELQDVRPVRETIQQGGGKPFIAKDLRPIGEPPMGGHEQRHAFVEGRAKLKESRRPDRREGDKPEFVDHDEVLCERPGEEPGQPMVVLGLDQLIDQARGIVEADLVPLPAGGQGQAGGDMRVPQAGVAEHENRLRLPEVVPACQVEHLLCVHAGQAGEIHVGPCLPHGEPRRSDQLGRPMLLPLPHLLLGQGHQEAVIAQTRVGGFLGQLAVVADKGREPQLCKGRSPGAASFSWLPPGQQLLVAAHRDGLRSHGC